MTARKPGLFIVILALFVGFAGGFALRHFLPLSDRPAAGSRDSLSLIDTALETASVIQSGDYDALAELVHPEEGVTFSPSATVDKSSNHTFLPKDLAKAAREDSTFVWGTTSDAASPINLTVRDYFAAYVWDQDYLAQPRLSVNAVQSSGNALENVAEAYPDGQYVEFYRPGATAQSGWTALKLVFEWHEENWYLVGIIHSSWSA